MNVDKLISDTLTLATFTSLSALMEVPLDFGGWLVTEMTHPKTGIGLRVLLSMASMHKEES